MMMLSNISGRFKHLSPINRILLTMGGGVLVLVVLFVSLVGLLWPAPHAATTLPRTTYNAPLSPLLFGTNLNLLDSSDQVLTSAATRDVLQQIHPQSVRIPLRSNLPPTVALQAANIVKSLGATPVVTLQGALDSNALSDDTKIIQTMNQVFGSEIVYYEYGNEDDLMGLSPESYTHSWNALVPLLKPLASHGAFIGPVTYRYDQAYLSTFLSSARPRPDGVSWHEYTCASGDSEQVCLAHLGTWSKHIANARAAMTKTVGSALPVMITEWNYAADASATDGKSSDATFMSTWTQKAFQTLVSNRVFASMQYSCTNTFAPLVNKSNNLTTQGAVFMSQYQVALTTGSPTASSTSATSLAASTPVDTATSEATTTTSTDQSGPPDVPTLPVGTSVDATPPAVLPTSIVTGSPGTSTTVTLPTGTSTTVTAPTGISTPVATPTPTTVATPKPTPTPTPKPASTTYAVDGKNPTTYTVGGKTCAATLSNSTAKAVSFGSVTGTLYFQFSITCHAGWAKIVFSKPVAASALGNAKMVRTGDGKTATCDTGGNKAVAPGQTSCYTGMIYDGPSQTASAYGLFTSSSGTTSTSARLGPF